MARFMVPGSNSKLTHDQCGNNVHIFPYKTGYMGLDVHEKVLPGFSSFEITALTIALSNRTPSWFINFTHSTELKNLFFLISTFILIYIFPMYKKYIIASSEKCRADDRLHDGQTKYIYRWPVCRCLIPRGLPRTGADMKAYFSGSDELYLFMIDTTFSN